MSSYGTLIRVCTGTFLVYLIVGGIWASESTAQENSQTPAGAESRPVTADPFVTRMLSKSLKGVPPSSYFAAVFEAVEEGRCPGKKDSSRCFLHARIVELVSGNLPSECKSVEKCEVNLDIGPKSGQVFQIPTGKRILAVAVRADGDGSTYATPHLGNQATPERVQKLRLSMEAVTGQPQ